MPALTDKELNPEFFQKLETRGSDDLPVEVVVPRKCLASSNLSTEEGPSSNDNDFKRRFNRIVNNQHSQPDDQKLNGNESSLRSVGVDDKSDTNQRDSPGSHAGFSKADGHSEGSFINNKGNWLAIQRQLMQLERQQSHLMNMLQVCVRYQYSRKK